MVNLVAVAEKFSDFASNYRGSIKAALLFAVMFALEEVVEVTSFSCPCKLDKSYNEGLVFLLVPAVLIFALGLASSTVVWRRFHGCFTRCRNSCCPPSKEVGEKPFYRCSCSYCWEVFSGVLQTLIPPAIWIFVALMDGSFYECMHRPIQPCADYDEKEVPRLIAQSRYIGMVFIAVVVLVAVIVWALPRCCSKMSYVSHRLIGEYPMLEVDMLERRLKAFQKQDKINEKFRSSIFRVLPDLKPRLSPEFLELAGMATIPPAHRSSSTDQYPSLVEEPAAIPAVSQGSLQVELAQMVPEPTHGGLELFLEERLQSREDAQQNRGRSRVKIRPAPAKPQETDEQERSSEEILSPSKPQETQEQELSWPKIRPPQAKPKQTRGEDGFSEKVSPPPPPSSPQWTRDKRELSSEEIIRPSQMKPQETHEQERSSEEILSPSKPQETRQQKLSRPKIRPPQAKPKQPRGEDGFSEKVSPPPPPSSPQWTRDKQQLSSEEIIRPSQMKPQETHEQERSSEEILSPSKPQETHQQELSRPEIRPPQAKPKQTREEDWLSQKVPPPPSVPQRTRDKRELSSEEIIRPSQMKPQESHSERQHTREKEEFELLLPRRQAPKPPPLPPPKPRQPTRSSSRSTPLDSQLEIDTPFDLQVSPLLSSSEWRSLFSESRNEGAGRGQFDWVYDDTEIP